MNLKQKPWKGLQVHFLIQSITTGPGSCPNHTELGSPTSINKQDNPHCRMPTGQSSPRNPSTQIPFLDDFRLCSLRELGCHFIIYFFKNFP